MTPNTQIPAFLEILSPPGPDLSSEVMRNVAGFAGIDQIFISLQKAGPRG